jgi:hypothetical protein
MCLAIIAERYLSVDLLVEQVFLTTHEGDMNTKEVYDVVLTPRTEWNNAALLCLSPHDLRDADGKLLVRADTIPGAGDENDVFYKASLLHHADYKHDVAMVDIEVPEAHDEKTMRLRIFSCAPLKPTVVFPKAIATNDSIAQLMEECGTLFEVKLGHLLSGKSYIFRLIVEPYRLLGLSKARSVDDPRIDPIQAHWVQDADIVCPYAVLFNYQKVVGEERRQTDYASAAAHIQTIIDANRIFLLPVEIHHIILIVQKGSELFRRGYEGCAWEISWNTLPDGRFAVVWGSGTNQNWSDDPEALARHVYAHFQHWGVADAKTKEEVSAALQVSHSNCSLIIDALHKLGFLSLVDGTKYRPAQPPPADLDLKFNTLAQSKAVRDAFSWQGYRISYALRYTYLTGRQEKVLSWYRLREKAAFWLSLLGVALVTVPLS